MKNPERREPGFIEHNPSFTKSLHVGWLVMGQVFDTQMRKLYLFENTTPLESLLSRAKTLVYGMFLCSYL
jgi:hypothetical protein